MKIIIFEDDLINVKEITFLLSKHVPEWPIMGIGNTISECKSLLKTVDSDLLISDIHFGHTNIFSEIPELMHFKGKIVFLTGDNNFATQAFEMSAIHYILKPLSESNFLKVIDKVSKTNLLSNSMELLFSNLENKLSSNKKFSFYTKDGFLIKKVFEIIFLKADNNYTEIYFIDGEKILISKTILYYEKLLAGFNFYRVHQSFIVNLEHVILYDRDHNYLKLIQGHIIQVSTRKKAVLMEMLSKVF